MLAPPVAKLRTKTAAKSTTKLAPHRSTLVAQFRGSAFDSASVFQRGLDQGLFQPDRNEAGISDHEQEARRLRDPEHIPLREAAGPSWDFSKISIFPPNQQTSSARVRLQPKIAIGAVNDPLEHEADRVADQVMRMPDPDLSITSALAQLSRKCAACEEEEKAQKLQTKPAGLPAADAAPPIVHEVLRSPGQPLDAHARAFFEPRFGRDFSDVRVHADQRAAESAASIGALAYTIASHVVFGSGRWVPRTSEGQKLIAHELVHVVQQTSSGGSSEPMPKGIALLAHELAHVTQNTIAPSPLMVARQTVEQYETRGVPIEREKLERAARFTYWEQKLQDHGFVPVMDVPTRVRLAFAEEHDAVLSVVWQMRPPTPTIAAPVTRLVTIPQRAAKGSRDLAYRITFRPPASPTDKGTVDVIFIAEGPGATALTPETPSTSFVPKTQGGYSFGEFPNNNDVLQYWEAHQDEQRQVFNWIENAAGARFDQVIVARTGSGASARAASFHVKGEKDHARNVSNLVIVFLGAVAAERRTAGADYLSHDFADTQIEEAQTVLDPIHKDKLGKINGLDKVPAPERASVKYAIWLYFRNGTRNAEVDAIVPILDPPLGMANRFNTNRRALYTFRLKPQTNDVDVVRIGEEGKEVSLARQGSLAQVNGFAAHAVGATEQDKVASLAAWLKQRYPGISPAASATVADLEKDVTTKIRDDSGDPAWFEKNYGIVILDDKAAAEWLAKKLGFKEKKELQDLKSFTPPELRLLELVLERMSDSVVKAFKNVRMVRQRVNFEFIPGTKPPDFQEKSDVAGDTIVAASRTIRIFDAAMRNIDALFLGGIGPEGKPSVVAAPTQPFAHELGHVVSYVPGVQKAFDDLVKAKGIKPITWYAGSDPPKELFPEAFSLFYLDPEWLRQNWPDLFNFFDALDKAGPPQKGGRQR
jgi:Domain of unknown function (DUF4157)